MTSESTFRRIYRAVSKGKVLSPRGMKVVEAEDFCYVLPPYVRFPNFLSRKLNLDYVKTEFLWYLRGEKRDLSILSHAQLWK